MPHAATTLDLLDRARDALTSGYAANAASARYLAASMAALRSAAALLAARPAVRDGSGPGPHDVWALTARSAPELAEWAQRFAAVTGQRVGVETGLVRVTAREADDLLRDAETFVDLVAVRLGVPALHPAARRLAPVRTA
ncbi:hypothetical protein JQN72_07140 [Phycicoccus sp. CSK15P-2]|uniref:SAV_6107 family HEPN domain-containing protein n=1 Tax=Phycicoccus sp. CSK15P-2 TaxID=2807627 RepID=UPI00194E4EDA|nr:SAV_6107 family HEPN domain-containing protein [Phycicoccus sp. CSK15P-2]MBM6404015.1 hypothetical protein [Phycicoccus sp. CSK15P-2]